jgi:hypothetical protein
VSPTTTQAIVHPAETTSTVTPSTKPISGDGAKGNPFENAAVPLTQLYRKNTDVQADALVSPYLGKWMRERGDFQNYFPVYVIETKRTHWFVQVVNVEGDHWVSVVCKTEQSTKDPTLSIMTRGSDITVVGKLYDVDGFTLTLDQCSPLK